MRIGVVIGTLFLLAVHAAFGQQGGESWQQKALYVDAFRLSNQVTPRLICSGDSLYTICDWYGVKGYDVSFRLTAVGDSTTIEVVGADAYRSGYYYVKTGLEEYPIATIYPGLFVETNTICSGFWGGRPKGKVWAYTYLYSSDKVWKGGHLYTLMWGEAPAPPVWKVRGRSTLVGGVPGLESTLEAYADGRYILRDWYGVEKYDLEFRLRPDGGIDIVDYYWVENGCRLVQCRRDDIGYAAIPQQPETVNGGLEGDAQGGRLHFFMTAFDNEDRAIPDEAHPEYIFEW
ncbi:MAG: hypothetical protein ACI37U_08500 [Bacteroides sp.]